MQTATARRKIGKKAFERELIAEMGFENLSCEPYDERQFDSEGNQSYQRLTLYYRQLAKPDQFGLDYAHYATWAQGEGWKFENFDDGVVWA